MNRPVSLVRSSDFANPRRTAAGVGMALLLGLGAMMPTSSQAASLTGLWEFDNGAAVGQATIGTDLVVAGTAPAWNATLADDGAFSLTGAITTASGVGNHLVATHNISANGGGLFVNEYSFLVDLFSPAESRSSWRTIYQTSTGNANDGDYFIRNSDDLVGVAALTYTPTPIDETAWTRLVVTFDLGNEVRAYFDGALVHVHNGDSVDGRFSLDPTVLFFADESNENASLHVGAVAIWDGVLTASEVAALGRAGNAIPEPQTSLLGLMALGALGFRRRRSDRR